MALLQESSAEVLGANTRAIKISLGSRQALVDLAVGPVGHEHGNNAVSIFGTAGWLALSITQEKGKIVHPWKNDKTPFTSGFNFSADLQAVLYIDGVKPEELGFRSIPLAGISEGTEDEGGMLQVAYDEGEFKRPLGFWVPGAKPTRFDTYTHRSVLMGVPGIDQVVVYSAEEVVRSYVDNRSHQ